jgi:hypothetical protein
MALIQGIFPSRKTSSGQSGYSSGAGAGTIILISILLLVTLFAILLVGAKLPTKNPTFTDPQLVKIITVTPKATGKPQAQLDQLVGVTYTPTPTPIPKPVVIAQGIIPSHNGSQPGYSYVDNLTNGKTYKVIISGTIDHNSDNVPAYHLYRDAQWVDNEGMCQNCFTQRAYVRFNGKFFRAIDGEPTYKTDHTYTFIWQADNTRLELMIPDSNYADNAGNLNYQVFTQ